MDFLIRFLFRACQRLLSLKRIARNLRRMNRPSARRGSEISAIASLGITSKEPIFPDLWEEYTKTLHKQYNPKQPGIESQPDWRATVMAESIFTEQALVNSPLSTEYFKHLPGILTGLGIIGTFSGLIQGLSGFQVSLNPNDTQQTLSYLIQAVGHAFYISATAVTLAIAFTCIEKFLLTACYASVENIQRGIDRLFRAGVGEEYLDRLVRASEISATQALHIKEALVADLKQILEEVTTTQVEASARNARALSEDLGYQIAQTLTKPREILSDKIADASARQEAATNSLLVDVLTQFSERMGELSEARQEQTSEVLSALESTAHSLDLLATSLNDEGKKLVDRLSEKIEGKTRALATHQEALDQRISDFLQKLEALVSRYEPETGQKLEQTASTLGEYVVDAVKKLQDQARSSLEQQNQESIRGTQQTAAAITSLSQEIEKLIGQSGEPTRALEAAVATLTKVTESSLGKLASGAQLLRDAINEFARSAHGVNATVTASNNAVSKIEAATQQLARAMAGSSEILEDYKKTREVFAQMVTELKLTMQGAKKEAFMTSDLIDRLTAAASQLGNAQRQAENYLKGINDVLTETHKSFAENIERTLSLQNANFHEQLVQAVGLLSTGIQDLESFFDRMPAGR